MGGFIYVCVSSKILEKFGDKEKVIRVFRKEGSDFLRFLVCK